MSVPAQRSLAFSPERMREELWRSVALPPELLQKAFERLNEQLDAQKVEYFAHHGVVVSKRRVVDNAARQGAIDKVLSMTGSYVREKDNTRSEGQTVTIEIGEDGVHRIILGGAGAQRQLPLERQVLDVDTQTQQNGVRGGHGMAQVPTLSASVDAIGEDDVSLSAAPELFHVPLDADTAQRSAMFDEAEPDGSGRIL